MREKIGYIKERHHQVLQVRIQFLKWKHALTLLYRNDNRIRIHSTNPRNQQRHSPPVDNNYV